MTKIYVLKNQEDQIKYVNAGSELEAIQIAQYTPSQKWTIIARHSVADFSQREAFYQMLYGTKKEKKV